MAKDVDLTMSKSAFTASGHSVIETKKPQSSRDHLILQEFQEDDYYDHYFNSTQNTSFQSSAIPHNISRSQKSSNNYHLSQFSGMQMQLDSMEYTRSHPINFSNDVNNDFQLHAVDNYVEPTHRASPYVNQPPLDCILSYDLSFNAYQEPQNNNYYLPSSSCMGDYLAGPSSATAVSNLGTVQKFPSIATEFEDLLGIEFHENRYPTDSSSWNFNFITSKEYEDTTSDNLDRGVITLCKSQVGRDYILQKFEDGNEHQKYAIFMGILPEFGDLMTDQFASLLCEKVLEYSTDVQRTLIIKSVLLMLNEASLNVYGSKVVEKMVLYLSNENLVRSFLGALNLNILSMLTDIHSSSVVLKFLETFPCKSDVFINVVVKNWVHVSNNAYGYNVVIKCLQVADDSQRLQLLLELVYNAMAIASDEFGSRIILHILDTYDGMVVHVLVKRFTGELFNLSIGKFSCKIIQKCIDLSNEQTRKLIIDELVSKDFLIKMLVNSYSNPIVQELLAYSDCFQQRTILQCVISLLPSTVH